MKSWNRNRRQDVSMPDMDNVVVTPHSAFYSKRPWKRRQRHIGSGLWRPLAAAYRWTRGASLRVKTDKCRPGFWLSVHDLGKGALNRRTGSSMSLAWRLDMSLSKQL
jgi:hypothetical protein